MDTSTSPTGGGLPGEVVSLCRALHQSVDELHLGPTGREHLLDRLAVAETMAHDRTTRSTDLIEAVRALRYVLLEVADGPLAPFLADSAASIIGDGHGKLFF